MSGALLSALHTSWHYYFTTASIIVTVKFSNLHLRSERASNLPKFTQSQSQFCLFVQPVLLNTKIIQEGALDLRPEDVGSSLSLTIY